MEDGIDLLAIDRIFLHDLCGTFSFQRIDKNGYKIPHPELVFATPDHTLATSKGREFLCTPLTEQYLEPFRKGCADYGIKLFDVGDEHQGIVHVIGPETGLSLPCSLIVCGDSHTCTHGAMGCLAYGLGTNEVVHALATTCLLAKRAKTLEICLHGALGEHIDSMDVILSIIAAYGVDLATGYAIVFTGDAINKMPMEERFTLCNLCIEMGADTAVVPVDEVTLQYLAGRPYAPIGANWNLFINHCRTMMAKPEDTYDRSIEIDISQVKRQVSWGINPSHTIPVSGIIPKITEKTDEKIAESYRKAYKYMDMKPGTSIAGTPINRVFIGSCSNGHLSTLQKVAGVIEGQHVFPGVEAWIVPGSVRVQREAEELGLDIVFKDAGFHWGEPCCALCVGSNGETVPAGERCVSTTNRNFVGRQGKGARTHLASARTAALAAINGCIG